MHELGVVLPRDRSDLGTTPFPGIDVRDVLRRALRAHADPTVTDAEIERVLPRTRSDPETHRLDPGSLTVRAVTDPWSMVGHPVDTSVTPDLCVPNVIEVLAQDLPETSDEIEVDLTALVGIAPTGPGGPTTQSFLPLPAGDR